MKSVFTQSWLTQSRQWGLASLLAIGGALEGASDCVYAQIVPDDTLGNKRSVINPRNPQTDIIGGGVERDANLFHSFREFSVKKGHSALFLNPKPAVIKNILSRVTGGSRSEIFGRLGVLGGTTNLFLINPNGIIFGPDSSLAVGGSFVATTANAIQFENQGIFSASDPESPPVLTVNPSALLFNHQITTQSITNQSSAGLQVPTNQSLLLVGGDVNLEGGKLRAPSGRVELGGLVGAGQVELKVDGSSLHLGFPQGVPRANVSFTNSTVVDVSSSGGGDIQVQGRRVKLTDGSRIAANTLGSEPGGTLTVIASESVEVLGGSRLLAQTQGAGAAGALTIETGQLIVRDGAQVGAGTFNEGSGGPLTVRASESVHLIGTSADGQDSSGLFTQTEGAGAAGELTIETRQLIVENGAQVSSSTLKEGAGGTLTVKAAESVYLTGTSTSASKQQPSGLFAVTQGGSGSSGVLKIETRQLVVQDGAQVSASTVGAGQGRGTLNVTASEFVQLTGTSATGLRSGLLVGAEGAGTAGDLTVETGQLIVRDGAIVSARTSDQGKGGNIRLQVRGLLRLSSNSQISTTAGTAGTGGDGGNIDINSQFIVAAPRANSDVTANAFRGSGGRINITTQGIFGIKFSDRLTNTSDITASSDLGINGVVEINTPDVDPNHGLVTLPVQLVDVSGLIAQGCGAGGTQEQSEFIVTGRGGLPPNPSDTLSSDAVWIDLDSTTQLAENRPNSIEATQPTNSIPEQLVEATGWAINDKGQVVLTASMPTATPYRELTTAQCHIP